MSDDHHKMIEDAIKDIFPPEVYSKWWEEPFVTDRLVICWKLNDDPTRPFKTSKIINIIFTYEWCEDFNTRDQSQKKLILQSVKADIEHRFNTLDPSNPNSINETPPREEWLIGFVGR